MESAKSASTQKFSQRRARRGSFRPDRQFFVAFMVHFCWCFSEKYWRETVMNDALAAFIDAHFKLKLPETDDEDKLGLVKALLPDVALVPAAADRSGNAIFT
jgi:hypothetical protein